MGATGLRAEEAAQLACGRRSVAFQPAAPASAGKADIEQGGGSRSAAANGKAAAGAAANGGARDAGAAAGPAATAKKRLGRTPTMNFTRVTLTFQRASAGRGRGLQHLSIAGLRPALMAPCPHSGGTSSLLPPSLASLAAQVRYSVELAHVVTKSTLHSCGTAGLALSSGDVEEAQHGGRLLLLRGVTGVFRRGPAAGQLGQLCSRSVAGGAAAVSRGEALYSCSKHALLCASPPATQARRHDSAHGPQRRRQDDPDGEGCMTAFLVVGSANRPLLSPAPLQY